MIYYLVLILYYLIGMCFFIVYDLTYTKNINDSLTEQLIEKNNIV